MSTTDSEFNPTHEIRSYGLVMLIDEGVEDGTSGAYTKSEFTENDWPRIRRWSDGRWMDLDEHPPEDVTWKVRTLAPVDPASKLPPT